MPIPEWGFSWPIFIACHFLLLPLAMGHALLHKRQAQSCFGWLVVIWAIPVGGTVLYGIFGVNRIRRRAQRLGRGSAQERLARTTENQTIEALPDSWQTMAHAAYRLSKIPLTSNNEVRHLHTGEQAFPVMLAAIAEAKESVYLSSYIFDYDDIGKRFVEALVDAASRGVDIRVLIDGVGDRLHRSSVISYLKKNNIAATHFLPPSLWPPAFYLNLRNHRKILVVDGKLAFTGGINICAKNIEAGEEGPANDDHFEFRGSVVTQLMAIFAADWAFAAAVDNDIDLSTEQSGSGDVACRALPEGPDRAEDQILMLMTTACGLARGRITLFSPYFLPMEPLLGAMCSAALRGVRVEVLIPEKNNYPIVDWACRHQLPRLLKYGISVKELPPPFLHSKLFLVDGQYAMVGSTNVDPRSLQLNFEVMVEIYDENFSQSMQIHADKQLLKGVPITLEALEKTSLLIRLRNALAGLAAPYL